MLSLAGPARAQGVVVAPHAIVIDHRTRSTSVILYNPGAQPTEVTIGTFFGYPVTDSAGDFELATPATPGTLPSAAGWIEAYPRRMVIGPLERQTVRLLARTPANLPDGEYWSRVLVTAKGGSVPIALTDSAATGITVGLNLEVRTILPLQYRKGKVTTSIEVGQPRLTRESDSLVIRARLVRHGNAAFIGTARGSLLDETGRAVASFAVPLAVYTDADPRFTVAVAGLPSGKYRFVLELKSDRTDIPAEQIVQAAAATNEATVSLP